MTVDLKSTPLETPRLIVEGSLVLTESILDIFIYLELYILNLGAAHKSLPCRY